MSTITITFAVRESKSRTSGEAPIQVLLTQNGARASFSTGKAVQPSEWDRDRQRVKGRDEPSVEYFWGLCGENNIFFLPTIPLLSVAFCRNIS